MTTSASEQEVAAVMAALASVLDQVARQPADPLRDWRRKRRQALRMHRDP